MNIAKVHLGEIVVVLNFESSGVRVSSDIENVILINQDINTVLNLVTANFEFVYSHYKSTAAEKSDLKDINNVSISIVLHYLYMYNTWRNTYKNKANLNLQFNEQDFSNPATFDMIISYYRKLYAKDWVEKSNIRLGMTIEDLRKYYSEREKFYNK